MFVSVDRLVLVARRPILDTGGAGLRTRVSSLTTIGALARPAAAG